MIALTDDTYDLWVKTLQILIAEISERLVAQVTPNDPDSKWIRQLWPVGTKTIDFATALGLCSQIGLVVPLEVAAESSARVPSGAKVC